MSRIKKMRLVNLVKMLDEYFWTEIKFTPEIPTLKEMQTEWNPQKGWCDLIYKNIIDDEKEVAIYNSSISEEIISKKLGENTKMEGLITCLSSFVKDFYNIDLKEKSMLIIDASSINHSPLTHI